MSHLFEKIPEVGEVTVVGGYSFTIMKKTQQNIEFVKIELVERATDDDND